MKKLAYIFAIFATLAYSHPALAVLTGGNYMSNGEQLVPVIGGIGGNGYSGTGGFIAGVQGLTYGGAYSLSAGPFGSTTSTPTSTITPSPSVSPQSTGGGVSTQFISQSLLTSKASLVEVQTPPTTSPAQNPVVAGKTVEPTILHELISFVTETTAVLTFDSSHPAQYYVSYTDGQHPGTGQGPDHRFDTAHAIVLKDLTPDTFYTFTITVDFEGLVTKTFRKQLYQFRTLSHAQAVQPVETSESVPQVKPDVDQFPPVNDFLAQRAESHATIVWKNPHREGYRKTVLVRSTSHFPQSDTDGEIIYVGGEESYTDSVKDMHQEYYYTAFAMYTGNILSVGRLTKILPVPSPAKLVPKAHGHMLPVCGPTGVCYSCLWTVIISLIIFVVGVLVGVILNLRLVKKMKRELQL